MKFNTKSIHIGNEPNLEKGGAGDVIIPIHLSTTFARKKVGIPTGGYEYSRSGNPTRKALEKNLAGLENGRWAFAFSSGLAAITTVLLSLKKGSHILSIDDVYGGTRRLFNQVFSNLGLEFTFADFSSAGDAEKHLKSNTEIIWIESPTNPLLKIVDIGSVCRLGRDRKILTVVDNTFASPFFQKPLDLGADVSLHSMTKYIGGHSDAVAGAVVVKDAEIGEKMKFLQNACGAILSPFDSYQVLKGIKTLSLRMKKHEENASGVVEFLKHQKKVKKIYYPGLPTHRGYDIAVKQMSGFGGMVSFELVTDIKGSVKFLESLRIISIAESLGVVESLIEHPASMTHASIPQEDREKIGLSDGLIRLSVGIEDIEDLKADITQALEKI